MADILVLGGGVGGIVAARKLDQGLSDESGWIPVDGKTLRSDADNVYAVGDVAKVKIRNSEVPMSKAGVFARKHGEVAADQILGELGENPSHRSSTASVSVSWFPGTVPGDGPLPWRRISFTSHRPRPPLRGRGTAGSGTRANNSTSSTGTRSGSSKDR